MKRFCELCKRLARMHCEADQASLCWNCDVKVHSANFLVARHSRNLLCQICQTPTPWMAAGAVLAPSVSVCRQCAEYGRRCKEGKDEGIIDAVEKVEENQVVPWSSPPAPEISSSSEGSVSVVDVMAPRKRSRIQIVSPVPSSNDDHGCSSSERDIQTHPPPPESVEKVADLHWSKCQKTPPRKLRRTGLDRVGAAGSEILESLRRLHEEETGSGAELTIDLNYSDPSYP